KATPTDTGNDPPPARRLTTTRTETTMLTNSTRWSHPHGNTPVPSHWQVTILHAHFTTRADDGPPGPCNHIGRARLPQPAHEHVVACLETLGPRAGQLDPLP